MSNSMRTITRACLAIALGMPVPALSLAASATDAVELIKTPDGGIQPQAIVDNAGTLHLIYYKGDPARGDIFYVHRNLKNGGPFTAPVRVNSVPHTAIAVGTIRGAQIAVGGNRVFVTWNGVKPQGAGSQMYPAFTRLNATTGRFEPQRNLLTSPGGVDGGGTVAADGQGSVYVMWHISPPGKDEAAGGIVMRKSRDFGKTFGPEKIISTKPTGQCGCCSMRAMAGSGHSVYVLYRAADANVRRDTTLLASQDAGATFRQSEVMDWEINTCPMSSFSLSESKQGTIGAWERMGQVYASAIMPSGRIGKILEAPGTGSRKYPVAVRNARGEMLLTWVEGSGWARGGSLKWQRYDTQGEPEGSAGTQEGVPAWSLETAVVRLDGRYMIFY